MEGRDVEEKMDEKLHFVNNMWFDFPGIVSAPARFCQIPKRGGGHAGQHEVCIHGRSVNSDDDIRHVWIHHEQARLSRMLKSW